MKKLLGRKKGRLEKVMMRLRKMFKKQRLPMPPKMSRLLSRLPKMPRQKE